MTEKFLDALAKVVLCGQAECSGLAVARFRWPGRDWAPACLVCIARAIAAAKVLGFELEHGPVKQPDGLFPPPRLRLTVD